MEVTVLDYGAGNIGSAINALKAVGALKIHIATNAEDIKLAKRLVFPGVGSFGNAVENLKKMNVIEELKKYIADDKPFFGICIGMQVLFEASEESLDAKGLGIFSGKLSLFDSGSKSVPHIGWNAAVSMNFTESFYFVHSFYVKECKFISMYSRYGDELFVSAVQKGNLFATQFHPEKSGSSGLKLLSDFLNDSLPRFSAHFTIHTWNDDWNLRRRIIPCLDVRSNDEGKLVVTKGSSYNVRDNGEIRNLGDPVIMAEDYYSQSADEIAFLNITAFKNPPLSDLPMLNLLKRTAERVFVPLTVGGGIKSFSTEENGQIIKYSALDVAQAYFRAGADKVSIGSDAVLATELYLSNKREAFEKSSIAQISRRFGKQAVVISIDPSRAYVKSPDETTQATFQTALTGPNGEEYVWFQCTINGGRIKKDINVLQLVKACEDLGAGEFMVNSIDHDGKKKGFDIELLTLIRNHTKLPIIASSGAGNSDHFVQVFKEARVDGAIAAGIFHNKEVEIPQVKTRLSNAGISIRMS